MLFVDDDALIRKLFSHALRQLVPKWTIHEANNNIKAAKETEMELYDNGDEKTSNSSKRHLFPGGSTGSPLPQVRVVLI